MTSTTRVPLSGNIEEGACDAKDFISLPGYMEQFERQLGYKPYAGTLNVGLNEASIERRQEIESWNPITIDGWDNGDTSFGPVFCLPATVRTKDKSEQYDTAHVIYPERTDHDLSTIELVAPVRLRNRLDISTDDQVTIEVKNQ